MDKIEQLFSTEATGGCLIKTDLKTQPDPFKTKPSPLDEGRVPQLSKQIKCHLHLIFTDKNKNFPPRGQNKKSSTKQETKSTSFNVNPAVAETALKKRRRREQIMEEGWNKEV